MVFFVSIFLEFTKSMKVIYVVNDATDLDYETLKAIQNLAKHDIKSYPKKLITHRILNTVKPNPEKQRLAKKLGFISINVRRLHNLVKYIRDNFFKRVTNEKGHHFVLFLDTPVDDITAGLLKPVMHGLEDSGLIFTIVGISESVNGENLNEIGDNYGSFVLDKNRTMLDLIPILGGRSGSAVAKNAMLDVAIVFDVVEDNTSPDLFDRQKDIVEGILSKQKIGQSNTLTGVILSNQEAAVSAYLNSYTNKNDLFKFLKELQKSGDGNNLKKSLQVVREQIFSTGRKGAFQTVIIFRTHNAPGDDVDVQLLQKEGVKVVVIGMGDGVDESKLKNFVNDKGELKISRKKETDESIVDSISGNLVAGTD